MGRRATMKSRAWWLEEETGDAYAKVDPRSLLRMSEGAGRNQQRRSSGNG